MGRLVGINSIESRLGKERTTHLGRRILVEEIALRIVALPLR